MKLLIGLFEKFDAAELVEAGFHQFLYESIKSEEVSHCALICDPLSKSLNYFVID